MNRFVLVNYADDIRHEIGNKTTLVGMYTSEMIVSEMPTMISKLCIYAQIFNNCGERFSGNVTFRVLIDDLLFGEEVREVPASQEPMASNSAQRFIFKVAISPFNIERECIIKTRVLFDDQEMRGQSLKVRLAREGELPMLNSPQ